MIQVVIYTLYGFIVALGHLNGSKWLTLRQFSPRLNFYGVHGYLLGVYSLYL